MDAGIPLHAPAALAPLSTADAAPDAARKFESFFLGQMMKQMRTGIRAMADEGSVFKDKVNEDMQDLADSQMADQMAGRHAFGIADVILRQLLPAAAPAPGPAPAAGSARPPFSAGPDPVASVKS